MKVFGVALKSAGKNIGASNRTKKKLFLEELTGKSKCGGF